MENVIHFTREPLQKQGQTHHRAKDASSYQTIFQQVIDHLYPADPQKNLAQALDVTPSAVNQWYKGKSLPSPDNYFRLVQIIQVAAGGQDASLIAVIDRFFWMAEQPIACIVQEEMISKFKGCETVSDYFLLEAYRGAGELAAGLPARLKIEYWRFMRALARELLLQGAEHGKSEEQLIASMKKMGSWKSF